MNEFLLIVSLVITYGGVILAYAFFGSRGLFVFGVFGTIVANIEVNFLIKAFGITQTLGNVLFASTFLITDALSEIKGKKLANYAVTIMLFFSIVFLIFAQLWIHFSLENLEGEKWQSFLSQVPRIIIVSLLVFALISYLDVWLYHQWWKWSIKICKNKEKWLWLRNNGSTMISQLINTILFSVGAFYGIYEWNIIVQIIASSYVIFVCLALFDTPVLYFLVYLAKQKKNYYKRKI